MQWVRARLTALVMFMFIAGVVRLLQLTGIDDPAEKVLLAAVVATLTVAAVAW